ncbi:MAG: hypothetical protein Q4G50_01220 [Corynebacterium sp.]|uniref:hypothetical protein n=1 Tax=Corynebacterium sp. TaxID=1720 RepID=UPI0026DED2CD|nr:hypothetical protein [Corynebacterium sp.]MDO5668601.1 hypothetical protein [Corynebacterium sp.]
MLCLDKCWRDLQRLTHSDNEAPRPAHLLVAGDVTHTGMGGIAHVAALSLQQVDTVADDLECLSHELRDIDDDYVSHWLTEAVNFTSQVRALGWGLVSTIG